MNSRIKLAAIILAALAIVEAGCEQPEHSYSGGYTGNAASVDEDNAMVNYDYTLDGPHTIAITPEKLDVSVGEEISVKITVKNTGPQPIYVPNELSQRIALLSRSADQPPEVPSANTTGTPVMLKCHALAPGDSASLSVKFKAGDQPGQVILYTNAGSPEEGVPIQVKA